ncbi:hypothetical protein [Streptomyces tsukubensis]|uniref:hypothetical protein n=1 Tax=Streptomyces tsukubensis TaxID=83656 RepID=UPI00344F44C8
MSTGDQDTAGHRRRIVGIRWMQAGLFALVVLLFAVGVGERESGGGSSTAVFGVMAASALAIGVLERYRARSVQRFRQQ